MRELSLFSGAGGGLLATKHLLGWETVGYVEFNEYCQKVIKARIADGLLDAAPIFGDIRRFVSEGYADAYQGLVDIVTFGAPCQPFSQAAAGRNTARDLLWAAVEVCRITEPEWVLCENVLGSAIRLCELRKDLEQAGFRCGTPIRLDASSLGAPHPRARLWLVGHAHRDRKPVLALDGKVAGVSKAASGCFGTEWWDNHPGSLGMDDGDPDRVERIKAVGNMQFPEMAATAWRLLCEG